jgi:hypothetical protein
LEGKARNLQKRIDEDRRDLATIESQLTPPPSSTPPSSPTSEFPPLGHP